MQFTLGIIGAIPVSFEQYDYVKVFALVDAKDGHGSAVKIFKYGKSAQISEFSHLKPNEVALADCTGIFTSTGKKDDLELTSVKFRKGSPA